MYFQYDTNDLPLGFVYNEVQYFYVANTMGDVIGITEANGNLIAQYLYDDWGKLVSIDTADAEGSTTYREIAEANPLRYRGYYFDSETGYYYLQSRYYDPEICRFINADKLEFLEILLYSPIDINLFLYSKNEPVNNVDYNGGCYYSVNLKWCHDNWEYRGGYKRKNAPGVSNYLFPSYYQIPIKKGGVIYFKEKKGAMLKSFPAQTKAVFFLPNSLVGAASVALSTKGVLSLIKKLIKEYKKSNNKAKQYTKEKLKKLILDQIKKKFGATVAKELTSFVKVVSVDTSFITDEILIYNQLKTIEKFRKKKSGIIIYKAKYTNKAGPTLSGTSFVRIEEWRKYVVNNPTKSGYYLKMF